MELDKKAIEELKKIYFQNTKQRISDEEVLKLAEDLLSLFKVICRPLPQKESLQNKENDPSNH